MKKTKLTDNHKKSFPYVLKFQLVIDVDDPKVKKMLFACLKINASRIEEVMYEEADSIMREIKKKKDEFILNPHDKVEDQIKANLHVPRKKRSLVDKLKYFVKRQNRLNNRITTDMELGKRK